MSQGPGWRPLALGPCVAPSHCKIGLPAPTNGREDWKSCLSAGQNLMVFSSGESEAPTFTLPSQSRSSPEGKRALIPTVPTLYGVVGLGEETASQLHLLHSSSSPITHSHRLGVGGWAPKPPAAGNCHKGRQPGSLPRSQPSRVQSPSKSGGSTRAAKECWPEEQVAKGQVKGPRGPKPQVLAVEHSRVRRLFA